MQLANADTLAALLNSRNTTWYVDLTLQSAVHVQPEGLMIHEDGMRRLAANSAAQHSHSVSNDSGGMCAQ